MKKLLFLSFVLLIVFCSCQNELDDFSNEKDPSISKVEKKLSRMKFNSSEELQTLLDQLKNNDYSNVKTRAKENGDFVSLNDYLTQIALDSLTEEELNEVQAEGLVYDPEDTLIADPNFCDLLNANREIEVGGKVYKYIPEGVLRCDVQEDTLLSNPYIDIPQTRSSTAELGNFVSLKNSLEFLPIDYQTEMLDKMPQTRASGLGNLVLENGVTVFSSDVKDTQWGHKGDAGWVQHGLSKALGKNTVVETNFDKRHRMKLRMYEQNYVVAKTIGMTLRMQQRRLRIWWRKKADEFHYGWTGLELQYRFKGQAIPSVHTPDWPKNTLGTPRVPDYISKKFPFYDNDIVLFYVPFVDYPVKTNDVNKLLWGALEKVSSAVKSHFKNHNKQGVFTTEPYPKDRFLRVAIPQIEKHAYHDGREVYRFDTSWLSGTYTVGVEVYPNLKYASVSFSQPYEAHIERGCVYGAVKWNGKWKAARIYTGD